MDLVYQISALRARFSATEHRIADACLQDLTFAASATIDRLAARAGVSRSALSRFAKTVGCQDIRDLRMQLAQAQAVGARFSGRGAPRGTGIAQPASGDDAAQGQAGGSRAAHVGDGEPIAYSNTSATTSATTFAATYPTTDSTPYPSADPSADLSATSTFGAVVSDIETILHGQLRQFDPPAFARAVSMLDAAQTVHSYGMGGTSTVMADECQHRLVRLGKPVTAYHDAVLMRMASAVAGPEHVILALSLTGLTPELLDAVRIARGYGAKVIAITLPQSPLAQLADVTLPLRVDETDFIYKPTAARYGMLLAIDILMTQFALLHAEQNQERLRRVKLVLDAYRDDRPRDASRPDSRSDPRPDPRVDARSDRDSVAASVGGSDAAERAGPGWHERLPLGD